MYVSYASLTFHFFKQVKWYKGTHEFYRYSPREEAKLFLVENLDVDVSVYSILAYNYVKILGKI